MHIAHILQSTFFLQSSQSNPVFALLSMQSRSNKNFRERRRRGMGRGGAGLVLVFETSSCNKRAREGRCSKNSSQPSEEIAVGRELLSRNVLTLFNFSCFPFPPLHQIDNFIIIIATLERRQIKQRDPEQLAGHPSLFHPFFLQRIKIFLLPSD